MQFDNVKTTIKDHPTETIAAVTVVGLVGAVLYCRRQNRKYQLELAQIQLSHAREVIELNRQLHSKYKLEFAQ